jgi:hypothetical protein
MHACNNSEVEADPRDKTRDRNTQKARQKGARDPPLKGRNLPHTPRRKVQNITRMNPMPKKENKQNKSQSIDASKESDIGEHSSDEESKTKKQPYIPGKTIATKPDS